MNSKTVVISKESDIKNISEVKGILHLIIHLTDYSNLHEFLSNEWKIKEQEFHNRSYSFFLFIIIDKLCRTISELPELTDFEYDYKLYRGLQTSNHFSVIVTTTRKSRICYEIFRKTVEIVQTNNELKDMVNKLNVFYKSISSAFEIFTNNTIESNLFSISNYIENLLNPIDLPLQANVEFISISRHFFEDFYDYLEYFKNHKGEWISSNGFFAALINSYKFLLGDYVFEKYKEILLIDELPFIDFSPEKNGFFPNFIGTDINDQNTKTSGGSIFITQSGILPIFRKTHEKLSELYHLIFKISHSHLYKKYCSKKYESITIDYQQIEKLIKEIDNFPNYKERFSLEKLFDYNKFFSIDLHNSIQTGLMFQILFNGLTAFCKEYGMDSNMIIIESDENNDYKFKFDKIGNIVHVPKSSDYHITSEKRLKQICYEKSNFEKINTNNTDTKIFDNRKYGFFREVKTYGTSGNDYTFWLGSFFYGSIDNTAETENLEFLVNEIRRNRNIYRIDHYILDFSFFIYLMRHFINIPILEPYRTDPFNLFFDSVDDIEDQIKINKFQSSYSVFLESFQKENLDNKTKKNALENLTKDLFNMSKQFEVLKVNFLDSAEEIDLIVETKPLIPDLSEILGKIFLVECKNMNSKITPKQIRDFGSKLPKYTIKTGIIVARKSTTGKNQDKGAKREIRDLINRGHLILILDKNDLEDISKGRSVSTILFRSFCRMYFKGLKTILK